MIRLSSRGDTIIEVLLAIAVVSAVLGGAYVSANRSLNGSRQSQERAEALKFVEGQLETLSAAAAQGPAIFTGTNTFCFNDTDGNALDKDTAPCLKGPSNRYRLTIRRDVSGNEFAVRAEWDRIGSNAAEQMEIVYRVYEE